MSEKLNYAECVYNRDEISAVIEVLENSRLSLMDGQKVREFESMIPNYFSKKHGLMVNSGSSANLLALASLGLEPGSEVITPALTFSTTVAPIVQLGLKPVFVDVEMKTLQACPDAISKKINKRTSAIMIPNLIGNVANWKEIDKIRTSKNKNILLIEDSADTIGYTDNGTLGNSYSDVSTTSFYASHIITGAGFGGFVAFKSEETFSKAKLLRGWGRRSAIFGESESIDSRFNVKVDGIDYDAKYIFDDLGYNFLPSEIGAAFALVQLKKLKQNIKTRQNNFNLLTELFRSHFPNSVRLFNSYENISTPWLAFPICLNTNVITRVELQKELEMRNVQTRTIFTGNILRQPVSRKLNHDTTEAFPVADLIMENGILLGCHHGNQETDTRRLFEIITEVFEKYGIRS